MDYLEFYGLKEHPFTNVVDNRFYYNSAQHAEALTKLKYAIDRKRGLAVVIGDIGTGKTTLARRLLEELDEEHYEATLLVVIHSSVSADWLLKKFAMQFGVEGSSDDKIEILNLIYRHLLDVNESGRKAVILIDEVQMLRSREIMEEFRGLLNMETEEGKMANFVFFGLPELEEVLSLDEPLKQRVAVKVRLSSLSEESTLDYVHHRIQVADSDDPIFSDGSLRKVYRYSRGIPRLINTICDNALLEGYLLKRKTIEEDIIDTVATDLGLRSER